MKTLKLSEIETFLNDGGEFVLLSAISEPDESFRHPLTGHVLTAAQREQMKAALQSPKIPFSAKPLALVLASLVDDNGVGPTIEGL